MRITKRKMTIILVAIISSALLLITGCSVNTPKIELNTYSFDLGDIDPKDGLVTETFKIKNTGTETLKIDYISTSCGCTTAKAADSTIEPGKETELTVIFDPNFHKGKVGPIKRMVYIQSNDPLNEETTLELQGNMLASNTNQSDEEEAEEHDEEYEGLLQDFEISPPDFYKKIKSNENIKILDVREDFEYEEGHIAETQLLSVNELSQGNLDNLGLNKDDEIIVYCRSGKRSAKAYQILTALGYTNVKSLYGGIVHWEEDKYPVEKGNTTFKKLNTSTNNTATNNSTPRITFNTTEHDFGQVKQYGGVVTTTFEVNNTGNADLFITSVSTSCGCTSAQLKDLVIEPGKSTILTVTFDPDFHKEPEGRFSRTVFLETNDPSNPEAEVKIYIDVVEGQ